MRLTHQMKLGQVEGMSNMASFPLPIFFAQSNLTQKCERTSLQECPSKYKTSSSWQFHRLALG